MDLESCRLNLVRRAIPAMLAEELVSVQPLSGNIISDVLKWTKSTEQPVYKQGELIHDFALGWLRYYGTDFIPQDLWIRLKIKGL